MGPEASNVDTMMESEQADTTGARAVLLPL